MEHDKILAIVDGEVAMVGQIKLFPEKTLAMLLSNPTFITTNEEVEEGYTWDGVSFSAPPPQEDEVSE